MPALDAFLRPFHVHFARSEATHALERYLTGMVTEQPNKNCDTFAQVVPDTSEQSLQGLLTNLLWDEDDLNRQRVHAMRCLPTQGDAALVFDDTGFARQGQFHRNSVLVLLASTFLVLQEDEHRQEVTLRGRPRGAFSPADRPPAGIPAGDPAPQL